MAQIEIQNVHKSFKTGAVLHDVSLSAETGEIVVVFGPSGGGKTVLLRLIAGVEEPDAGVILLQGRDVADEQAVGVGQHVVDDHQLSVGRRGHAHDGLGERQASGRAVEGCATEREHPSVTSGHAVSRDPARMVPGRRWG